MRERGVVIPRRWSSADVIERTGCTARQLDLWRGRHFLGVSDGQGSRARYSWREMLAVRCLVLLGPERTGQTPLVRAVRYNVARAVVEAVELAEYLLVRPERWQWLEYERSVVAYATLTADAWQILPVRRIAAQMTPRAPR